MSDMSQKAYRLIYIINVFVFSVFSQTAKCITSKLQNVFVPNCKMCLSQVAKFVCLVLSQIAKLCHTEPELVNFFFFFLGNFSVFSTISSILYIWYLSKLVDVQF